ncbi:MAG: hypothetical protein MUO73_03235 [Thermoplasmata archaeon]|nr:hypothetical protein [Thermoplasmata archaeon]
MRCETCKHCIPAVQKIGYTKCELTNYLLDSDCRLSEFINRVGCASHSSTTSAEKVLKELLDFIDNADNQFDKQTVHKLVDWVVSMGVIPDAR